MSEHTKFKGHIREMHDDLENIKTIVQQKPHAYNDTTEAMLEMAGCGLKNILHTVKHARRPRGGAGRV